MIYIYLGQADLYLPVTAAAFHLKLLDKSEHPNKALSELPLFRPARSEDDGKLHHLGNDKNGEAVYVISVKNHPDIFVRAVQSLLGIYELSLREAVVIPCVPENPQVSLICNILARIGLHSIANNLGTRLSHNRHTDLHHLVLETTTP
jgi:hypothetical protein